MQPPIEPILGTVCDYRARYYDPIVGRFASEDPVGFATGSNFYGYVENSPTEFVDPSGYCRIEVTYTSVGLLGNHAAIITTDATGSTVTRAAAGEGIILPFDPPKNACVESKKRRSKIVAEQTGYGPGSPDYEPHPPTQLVLDDQLPCTDYNRRLRDFVDRVNRSGLIYQTGSRNSNTFAREALTSLGLKPPVPPVWTPGWNSALGLGGK